jgi:hypothetical protein
VLLMFWIYFKDTAGRNSDEQKRKHIPDVQHLPVKCMKGRSFHSLRQSALTQWDNFEERHFYLETKTSKQI